MQLRQPEAGFRAAEEEACVSGATPSVSALPNPHIDTAFSSLSTLVQETPTPTTDSKKNGLDAMSLSKWNRLAEKGGIGSAVALEDCMANRKGELMFFAGDRITVLRVLIKDSTYLGQCEGVIGRFYHQHVRFDSYSPSTQQFNGLSSFGVDRDLVPKSGVMGSPKAHPTLPPQPVDSAPSLDEDGTHVGRDNVYDPSTTPAADDFDKVDEKFSPGIDTTLSASCTDDSRSISLEKIGSPACPLELGRNSDHEDDEARVQAMALTLKSFAKDDTDLDAQDGLRSTQSRRSSTVNSDDTWSSADEQSDEDSEGSIRYPTTISFIDRIKALRIPAAVGQQIEASIPPIAEPVDGSGAPEVITRDEQSVEESKLRSEASETSQTPAAPLSLSTPTPPRPEKSRLRIQQPGMAVEQLARETSSDSRDNAAMADVTSLNIADQSEKPSARNLTRESNPFEFAAGLSGLSTPNEVNTPVEEELRPLARHHVGISSSAQRVPTNEFFGNTSEAVTAGEDSSKATTILRIPDRVARELANRLSTASDVLRKNHVDDVGVQSYFPVIGDSASTGIQAGDQSDEQPDGNDADDQIETGVVTVGANANQVPAGEVESSPPMVTDTTLSGSQEAPIARCPVNQEVSEAISDGEWDVSNEYAGFSTSPLSESTHTLPDAQKSMSVLNDSTSIVNNTMTTEHNKATERDLAVIDVRKKPINGILKVQTNYSPSATKREECSPQSIHTPSTARAFRDVPLEASLSPDSKRFRAFSFLSASANSTPTRGRDTLDVQRANLTPDGHQSAIATKLVHGDTIHGQLTMELTSARHPVPINFLPGHSVYNPQSEAKMESPEYATPNRHLYYNTDTASPSPTFGKRSPHAHSSPFFPSPSEKPRSRSFSTVEVIVPIHRSGSSNSLKAAYAGVTMQTSAANTQQQGKENQDEETRRSLSRSGTAKLSAIRRKLSLRGEQRPDMNAILARESPPPIPKLAISTSLPSHKGSESSPSHANITTSLHSNVEAQNGLPLQKPSRSITTAVRPDLPPPAVAIVDSLGARAPVSHSEYRSPLVKVADASFALNEITRHSVHTSVPDTEPIYDEYGFLASESPVPQLFATMRTAEKEVSKVEQTLLALTEHPPTRSSDKKVRHLVEAQSIPPSVRGRVWKWLLNAPSIPHHQYQVQIDSFKIPSLQMDPGLVQRFGFHRAFMNGFHTIEQIMFLYITRNRTAPPSPDTIWIASLFLTQSFHEAEGYALYQSFLQRMAANWTDKQIRAWAQIVHEVVYAHDPDVAQHLAKCLDLYYIPLRRWTLTMFAETLPLPTCLRAMDLIIVQGPTVIVKLASVLFLMLSKQIIKLVEPSEIINFLLHPPQDWMSPDTVFRAMSKITLSKKSYQLMEAVGRR